MAQTLKNIVKRRRSINQKAHKGMNYGSETTEINI